MLPCGSSEPKLCPPEDAFLSAKCFTAARENFQTVVSQHKACSCRQRRDQHSVAHVVNHKNLTRGTLFGHQFSRVHPPLKHELSA